MIPLNLAIEMRDVDMCALLLKAGAEPKAKANGAQAKTAIEMAEAMLKDPKTKEKGEQILKFINDPKALDAHADVMAARIKKESVRDLQLMRNLLLVLVAIGGAMAAYFFYFRHLKGEQEL